MNDSDLSTQLDQIEKLLSTAEKQFGAFETRIESTKSAINDLTGLVPKLDLLLALAASARSPDPATYQTLAQSIFEPLQTRLGEVEQALEISFSPVTALDGLTEKVQEKLSEIDVFATEAASTFAEDVSDVTEQITEGITSQLRSSVAEWQANSEEAEASVVEAAEDFEAFRENATTMVEDQLRGRLLDLLGSELGEVTGKIDSVFDEAEKVLDRAEGLVSDGVSDVTSNVDKVLEIQRAVRDLRPLMEILM